MRLSRREAREVRSDRVNDFADRKARDELIGQLLDKGHDLRVEGDGARAGACLHAATELARAGS
jgi:hypothetical protein